MKKQTGKPLTVCEWLARHGREYRLTTEEYVRRCCRGDRMATGHVCHLPKGWVANRWGRTWLITWMG